MPRRAVRLLQRRRSIHSESSGLLGFLCVYAWLLHLARIPAHLPQHEDAFRYKYYAIEKKVSADGKVIYLIHDLNPIATHFPYSTANSYNAIARFRSDAMAQAPVLFAILQASSKKLTPRNKCVPFSIPNQ